MLAWPPAGPQCFGDTWVPWWNLWVLALFSSHGGALGREKPWSVSSVLPGPAVWPVSTGAPGLACSDVEPGVLCFFAVCPVGLLCHLLQGQGWQQDWGGRSGGPGCRAVCACLLFRPSSRERREQCENKAAKASCGSRRVLRSLCLLQESRPWCRRPAGANRTHLGASPPGSMAWPGTMGPAGGSGVVWGIARLADVPGRVLGCRRGFFAPRRPRLECWLFPAVPRRHGGPCPLLPDSTAQEEHGFGRNTPRLDPRALAWHRPIPRWAGHPQPRPSCVRAYRPGLEQERADVYSWGGLCPQPWSPHRRCPDGPRSAWQVTVSVPGGPAAVQGTKVSPGSLVVTLSAGAAPAP